MSRIEGMKDLRESMDKISDVDLTNIMKKWTEYVRGEAVDLCPVSPLPGGGQLRQSIMTDVTGHGSSIEGIVYTNKEYAPYVEFGTGRRGAASTDVAPGINLEYSQDINGQAAQPFMYPALNNNQTRILRGITQDLQKAMRD